MLNGRLLQDASCMKLDAFYSGSLKVDNSAIKNCVAKCGFYV